MRWLWPVLGGGAAATLVLFFVLPLVGLAAATGPRELVAGLRHPLVAPALWLSLYTTTISLVVVVLLGTPLGWLLARRRGRLSRAVETLVHLPVVIPPAVAGVAMLMAFGRRGLVGRYLPDACVPVFTTSAVVLAQVFVSAPFYVQAAASAFRRIDENLLVVARTLGASPPRAFLRVALPLAAPGLVGGAALAWARALGEFGATLLFAGNMTGRTQTLPLAVYTALESEPVAAQALALVLVAVAFALLLGVRAGAARLPGP